MPQAASTSKSIGRKSEVDQLGLHHGDCLSVLPKLGSAWADLAYLDPPFATGRRQRGRGEASFEDSWPSIEVWLAFICERLEATIDALTPTGNLLVHCDWRTSHHLRVWLDQRLGTACFQNHIVWHYGLGGSSPRRFARKHDDILFYSRSESWYFDPPMVRATSQRMRGEMKKSSDVLDIPSLNNMAHERTDWPTQKPLALLETLVNACCVPGGVVLDPMCGSGTTLQAAARTGRRYCGIDRSEAALSIANERLQPASSAR